MFKGAIAEISKKVFITGHQQASKYDDAHKILLSYINRNFNHRVHLALEHKDAAAGLALLLKSKAPKKSVVVQEEDLTDRLKTTSVTNDKDSEDFYEYLSGLKNTLITNVNITKISRNVLTSSSGSAAQKSKSC